MLMLQHRADTESKEMLGAVGIPKTACLLSYAGQAKQQHACKQMRRARFAEAGKQAAR